MVKRKRKTTSHHHIKGVRVYLDELEAIVEEAESRGFDVEISDHEHVYDSLQELVELRGPRPNSIEISFSSHGGDFRQTHVLLKLDNDEASIHSGLSWENSAQVEAFGRWLAQRASTWVPGYRRLLLWPIWATIALVLTGIGGIIADAGGTVPYWLVGIAALALLAWPSSAAAHRMLMGMNLYRRHEANVWTRNRDQILTLAIGTAIGAALMYLVQLLF